MPTLSIITAALDGTAQLERDLVPILQYRPADSEVVVVLREPYEDPYDLKEEVRFVTVAPDADLVRCFRAGWEASSGPLVHLLASGLEVTEDWTLPAVAKFEDPAVSAVAVSLVDRFSGGCLSAGVAFSAGGLRRPAQPCDPAIAGPDLRASFYRRTAVESVGHLAEHLGAEGADLDLAVRLHAAGHQFALADESTVVAAPSPATPASFGSGYRAELAYLRGAIDTGLVRAPWRHAPAVLSELLTMGQPVGAVARLMGRVWARFQFGQRRRQQILVQQLAGTRPHASAKVLTVDQRLDASHAGRTGRRTTARRSVVTHREH